MATTGVDFVLQNKVATQLSGATVTAAPFLLALDPVNARAICGVVPGGAGTTILSSAGRGNNGNWYIGGFAEQGFAKNGGHHKTTSGTTGVTVDVLNLATGATTTAGDTVFATVKKITIANCGTAAMTIAPGGSNPADLPKFAGTTPTLNLPAGSQITFEAGAGVTFDATHRNILITPTSGGDVVVAVGGA